MVEEVCWLVKRTVAPVETPFLIFMLVCLLFPTEDLQTQEQQFESGSEWTCICHLQHIQSCRWWYIRIAAEQTSTLALKRWEVCNSCMKPCHYAVLVVLYWTGTVQKNDAGENGMWGWLLTDASFCASVYFCPSHQTRYYSPSVPINDSHCLIKKWKMKGQKNILQKNLCIWFVRSMSRASP